ncbi:MAG: MaoC family dehydratase N-terminal domain-containing protein [Deltaproteobacteria bacterium]|nr:MaoC family dehydratase N-terminal domain-containing protein [Deltaproteobacteria bacterium]
MEKGCFEDFKPGDSLVSPGRTITETDLVLFANLTGDWHQLHTDAEYAKDTAFGERIAQGLLILSIAGGLMFRGAKSGLLADATLALWSLDKVRFVGATRIGDTVHLESEITQLTEVDLDRGLLTMNHRVKNQRGEEVLTCTLKLLVKRRSERRPLDG